MFICRNNLICHTHRIICNINNIVTIIYIFTIITIVVVTIIYTVSVVLSAYKAYLVWLSRLGQYTNSAIMQILLNVVPIEWALLIALRNTLQYTFIMHFM